MLFWLQDLSDPWGRLHEIKPRNLRRRTAIASGKALAKYGERSMVSVQIELNDLPVTRVVRLGLFRKFGGKNIFEVKMRKSKN